MSKRVIIPSNITREYVSIIYCPSRSIKIPQMKNTTLNRLNSNQAVPTISKLSRIIIMHIADNKLYTLIS